MRDIIFLCFLGGEHYVAARHWSTESPFMASSTPSCNRTKVTPCPIFTPRSTLGLLLYFGRPKLLWLISQLGYFARRPYLYQPFHGIGLSTVGRPNHSMPLIDPIATRGFATVSSLQCPVLARTKLGWLRSASITSKLYSLVFDGGARPLAFRDAGETEAFLLDPVLRMSYSARNYSGSISAFLKLPTS